ncbi:MAG: hypothetical protein ACRYFU_21215 [Janthinobacterium lividum]
MEILRTRQYPLWFRHSVRAVRGAFVNASRSTVEDMPIMNEQNAMIYTGNVKMLLQK